jgi:hypothetical protein
MNIRSVSIGLGLVGVALGTTHCGSTNSAPTSADSGATGNAAAGASSAGANNAGGGASAAAGSASGASGSEAGGQSAAGASGSMASPAGGSAGNAESAAGASSAGAGGAPYVTTQPFANPVITVDAASVLRTIPRDLFGINMATWTALVGSGETTYEERMKVAGVTQIRWPGGSYADIVDWNDLNCPGDGQSTTDQEIAFIATFGGNMQPIVNFSGFWCQVQHTHAQAVTKAAQWVTYMNVTNHYGTKIWEVGNEDYGKSWEQGATDGTTYGTEYADYYNAMKAVDSTIQVGAVGEGDPTADSNFTNNMLSAAHAKGVTPDFIIIHEYPYYTSNGTDSGAAVDAAVLNNVGDVSGWTSALNAAVSKVYGSSAKIPYRMTEYSGPLDEAPIVDQYLNAMFASQFMLEIATQGWAGANLWAAKNGTDPKAGGDWGFLDANNNPRPDYYVFPMLTSKFGSSQVSATSANKSVRSYAAKDSKGDLTLFLVNNSPNQDIMATVNVNGFNPAATGSKWLMLPSGNAPSGAPQEASALQINGVVNPDPASLATLAGVTQPATNAFTVELPASAMVLVVLPPG